MTTPRILLVDNEKDTLLITRQFLLNRGYAVTTSSHPKNVIQHLQRGTFSAVILDLRLSNDSDPYDFSGLDLAEKIAQFSAIPIILSTQFPAYDVAIRALSGHLHRKPLVADIVSKMDGLGRLLAALETILIPKRIFLSYVREDEKKVRRLYTRLEKAGFHPWMDTRDIRKGARWEHAIECAIAEADFFVICLSGNSQEKRGYFRLEVNKAINLCIQKLDDDIFLIPLRLDSSEIRTEELRRYQWVNYYESGGFEQLLQALRSGGRRYLYSS